MLRLATLSLLMLACGGGPVAVSGPDPCEITALQLKRRLGPELNKIVTRQSLPLPAPSRGGCALVYTQVSEEMAGEVEGEFSDSGMDQRLAIGNPDTRQNIRLVMVDPAQHSPLTAALDLSLQDVNADKEMELVVIERSMDAGETGQGLRVFSYGVGGAVEIFSDKLEVKTPEGLKLLADWRAEMDGAQPKILLGGAGVTKAYSWNPTKRLFTLDKAAPTAKKPVAISIKGGESSKKAAAQPEAGKVKEAATQPKKDKPKKDKPKEEAAPGQKLPPAKPDSPKPNINKIAL